MVPREGSVSCCSPQSRSQQLTALSEPRRGSIWSEAESPQLCLVWPPHREGGPGVGWAVLWLCPWPRLHDPQPHIHELPPAHPELFSVAFTTVDGSFRGRSCSVCRDVQFLSGAFFHEIRQPGSLGGDGAQPGFVLLFPGRRLRPICLPHPSLALPSPSLWRLLGGLPGVGTLQMWAF